MGDLAPPPGTPGIPLGSLLEVFPALHSSFLFLPFSFQQEACVYVWLSLVLSCCPFSGLVGWLCQLPFFVSRGSEHVEYPENNFKLGGNLTEWHSTGLSPGSVPSLAFFLSISSIFFSARSMCVCLVVTGFVMFCPFSGLVGWLCQLPFLFPGVPSMSNTPKIISNLGEISQNGIPLSSLLEVFPALHSFFLFLAFSFQQEACVYVWFSLVLSCCPFSGLVGQLCQMAFHWALSWKRSQPCILPFCFFQRLFSKKHVFMFCRLLVCGTLRGKLIYLIEVHCTCINYHKIRWFWNAMIYLY